MSFSRWAKVSGLTIAAVAGSYVALRKLGQLGLGTVGSVIMKDPYRQNLLESFSAGKRVGLQNIAEAGLRSEHGKPLQRPFGSPKRYLDFDDIMFNFAQLDRLPTPETTPIDTAVTIGPQAERPMTIDIPIMITAMAYGPALSSRTKLALAKGSAQVRTATNSGEGGSLPEERAAAHRYILQLPRATWNRDPKLLREADMIELNFGQGASGAMSYQMPSKKIRLRLRKLLLLEPGEDATVHNRMPEVSIPADLIRFIDWARKTADGVPIGIKLAAGARLEEDMALAVQAGVDAIAISCAQGGSAGSPPILQDDFGLPTLYALVRAANFLRTRGLSQRVTLIVAGGLTTPGDMLKALALGADAVYIGTMAVFSMVHTEIWKSLPWEPPTQLVCYDGKLRSRLSVNKGAHYLANFLESTVKEMEVGVRALGKQSIHQLTREDLVALTPDVAEITGLAAAWTAAKVYQNPTVLR